MNITYHNVVSCVVADSKFVVGAVDFIDNIAESSVVNVVELVLQRSTNRNDQRCVSLSQ